MMKEYIAIDLEFTGLDLKSDKIIEIGAIKVREGCAVEDAEYFSALVNPNRQIPERVVELTGITDAMVAEAEDITSVLPRFLDFAEELPLLGHNLMYDYSFLKQVAVNQKRTFERKGIDTLKIARKLLPPEEKKSLEALKLRYDIRVEESHRAYSDAYVAAKIYERFKLEYEHADETIFMPQQLNVRVKKQSPASQRQKDQIKELIKCHGLHTLEEEIQWACLTRSEASRMYDVIIRDYGKIKKQP